MRYEQAIVREVSNSLVNGLTEAKLGKPDIALAKKQHAAYVEAIRQCGLEITVLPPLEEYPDAVFVEDVAVVFEDVAVLTRPGAPTRRGEVGAIEDTIEKKFKNVERIIPPGTLEGGDVLQVDDCFYVGISQRTNNKGFQQFSKIVGKYGKKAVPVPLHSFLHLKTGVAWWGENRLVLAGECIDCPEFSAFTRYPLAEAESYAANSLVLNGVGLIPAGFPSARRLMEQAGIRQIIELDMSEFRKVDGGLSCLSLRF